MKYLFPNPQNNSWIDEYNNLVLEVEKHEQENKIFMKTQPKRNDQDPGSWSPQSIGIHHIIPKKIDSSLKNDRNNWLYVNFFDHCTLHYYLWKADPQYAPHLMFIAYAGRKMGLWNMPGGEVEWEELRKDISEVRKNKKKE